MASGVGIDLGASSVKVVDLRISEKGAVIRRAIYLDKAALLARGVDPADRKRLAGLLKREMNAARIPTREVVLGVSGRDSIIRYTHVPPVPAWRLQKIMEYEVGEVAEKIGEKLSSDYRVLPVTRDDDDDQTIIIGLAKEPALDSLLGDLAGVGITVAKALPAPLALYAAYSAFGKKPDLENPEDELVVVVDIGSENLNAAFLLNGNLSFARSASFGGKNFTEAIARDLGIDLERAEALKLKGGTLEPGGGGRKEETVMPLRGAASQLLNMIQSSLKFSKTQTGVRLPEPTRVVVLGGAAALPGLVSYLQTGLQRPVETFHPSASPGPDVEGEAAKVLARAPGDFGAALGLAAAAVRRNGFELSLLPTRYRERRKFWDRTLYLYLAAAFLMVFLSVRLAQGLGESGAAKTRARDLASWKGTFESHRASMLGHAEENSRIRARINRILREAEVAPFQAFVLDFLSRRVGPELKIEGLKLLMEDDQETGEPIYQFQIDGAADNASQKALERINGLRASFAAEVRVREVNVISTRQVGIWYQFQMVLVPTYPVQR